MDKKHIIDLTKKQVAIDLACSTMDFDRVENTIVTYKQIEGRRMFRREDYFIRYATFGKGAVVSADPSIHGWCREFFSKNEGIRCFEYTVLCEIEKELLKHGKKLGLMHEFFLPDPAFKQKPNNIEVRWFEKDEIPSLYSDKRFKNALLYDVNHLRPDILVVVSYDGDKITGMVGASEDSKSFWQIGIDVIPEYRRNGLATFLVGLLTDETLKRGIVPYYGTWSANIASRNVARSCGYFPAWVEVDSVDIE